MPLCGSAYPGAVAAHDCALARYDPTGRAVPASAGRQGCDEYAVLGIECGAVAADNLSRKISGALSAQGIQASVGMAMRDPRRGFAAAVAEADQAMYAAKAERRTQRTGEASPVPSGEFERADDAG